MIRIFVQNSKKYLANSSKYYFSNQKKASNFSGFNIKIAIATGALGFIFSKVYYQNEECKV